MSKYKNKHNTKEQLLKSNATMWNWKFHNYGFYRAHQMAATSSAEREQKHHETHQLTATHLYRLILLFSCNEKIKWK